MEPYGTWIRNLSLSLALTVSLLGGSGSIVAANPGATGVPATYPGSLEEVLARFPRAEANTTALELETLSSPLGIDLATRSARDRARPTAEAARAFDKLKAEIGAYLAQQIERPELGAAVPPASVARFLESHQKDLGRLRACLRSASPPRWERDIEKLLAAPIPNLLGHIWLHKVLMADALSKAAHGDDPGAIASLEASWTLSGALRDEPALIVQLVAMSIATLQTGTLRQMRGVPESWIGRIEEHSYRDSVMRALLLEGWVWTQVPAPPDTEDPPGLVLRIALAAGQPYARLCLDDTAELWRRQLAKIAETDSFCDADLSQFDRELRASIPWWNRLAERLTVSLGGVLERVARLEIGLELTGRILRLDAARRRNGDWPSSLPGSDRSTACPDCRWIYAADGDAAMSIALSREPAWHKSPGIGLPTRHTRG